MKQFLSLSIVIMMTTVISGFNVSYAFLSMDSIIQKLTQISAPYTREAGETNTSGKDLFLTIVNQYTSTQASSGLKSIQSIKEGLTKTAYYHQRTCQLNNNDITTVLANIPDFVISLYTDSHIALSQGLQLNPDNNLKQSCEKILICLGALGENEHIVDNQRQIEVCQTTLYNAYTNQKTNNNNSATIPLANNNDNIFIDGVPENALFDILIDIGNVNTILFKSNEGDIQTPQIIYYSLPKTVGGGQGTPQGSTNGSPGIGGVGATGSSSGIPPIVGNSTPTIGGTEHSTQPGNQSLGSSLGSELESELIDFIGAHSINTTTLPYSSSTSINQLMCVSDTPNNTPTISNENSNTTTIMGGNPSSGFGTTDNEMIDDLYDIQNTILNTLSGYMYDPNNSGIPNYGQNYINLGNGMPTTTQECNTSCAETEGTEKLICEGKCCINSCTTISDPGEKAICLSQCICGQISIPQDLDILRIKICRVTPQVQNIVAGKTIMSIEEGVDEINTILLKLQQGGALIKRTKKQDLFDSSFSDIKFSQILAFDIFVATKPIYDTLQLPVKEQQIQNNFTNISDLNSAYQDNPNKYAVVNKHTTLINTGNAQDITKSITLDNSITTRIDSLNSFFSEQLQLRNNISEQLIQIRIITENLSEKAKNAQ